MERQENTKHFIIRRNKFKLVKERYMKELKSIF